MDITSPVFENGKTIPRKYTCDGENINPPLIFDDVPENAKSLVLLMEDPDVPHNIMPEGVYDRWVVFNIPPNTDDVDENQRLPGIYGSNTHGDTRYTGPCPPDREHRYFFRLFALDRMLNLKEGATKEEVEDAMENYIIEAAELIGKYNRHPKK